jgi:hypothetical protein
MHESSTNNTLDFAPLHLDISLAGDDDAASNVTASLGPGPVWEVNFFQYK